MQQFLFTHLGSREGLASDETTGVQQDEKGFIWISTLDGLQRYDGKRLLTFRNLLPGPQQVSNDMIRQIQFDKKNRLWICTAENRVGWFDVSNFTFHEAPVDFPVAKLLKAEGRLYVDQNQNLLLVLGGASVLTYNETSNRFSTVYNPFRWPTGWNVNWVTQDATGKDYWIACDSGLAKFNVRKNTLSYRGHNTDNDAIITAFEKLNWVSTPFLDSRGRFWLLSWPTRSHTDFYSFDPALKQTREWQAGINKAIGNNYYFILSIQEQSDSSLWLIGGNLFARLDKAGTEFGIVRNNLAGEFSIRYDALKQLYEDREHNLWACTNNGLFRFNPSAQVFRVIANKKINKDSIFTSNVSDILQTRRGQVLVSTWGNGLFPYDSAFNPVSARFVDESRQMGESLVWCIYERSNGDIWRGNQNGTIFIYHAATGRSEKLRPPVFEDWSVRHIVEDGNKDLWLATTSGILVKWSAATGTFEQVKKINSTIQRLYSDSPDFLWVCTQGNGIFKIRCNNGEVVENYRADGPPGKQLMRPYALDITRYDDSVYLIASGGINILNTRTNTIRFLVHGNDFPVNNISNIVKDKMGKLWVTTQSGLGSVDLKRRITSTYDQRDGVHTNFFNGASTALLNDGRIAFGSTHDLLVFDPMQVHNLSMPLPNVTISAFLLMNEPLLVDSLSRLKLIELPYDKNSVIIEFSTLTFQNNFGTSYMLEGLDKTWKRDYGDSRAIYTYLPPGTYVFKTKVENGDQAGDVKFTAFKIKVKSPFWKTWWFFSLLAFAGIGLVYWLDKFRVARIRETERVRTRIATSLTKDMGNTLGNINVLSELAKVKLDKDIDRTRDYIGQISDNSNRMMEVMDDMIWSINPENDELKYTISRMKKYAASMHSRYGVEIDFTVDKRVDELKLQMDRRYELFLIFKEAILNAGKHANTKFADVDIRLEKSRLKMTITDNGQGFNTDAASFGRGLVEMRKKAAALNATLQVRSVENSGTEIVLEMNL